jgi:hypothetical protein
MGLIKDDIINAFNTEFGFIKNKFELIDLLDNNSPMNYDIIKNLWLPSDNYNIVWHPGVYIFIGNNSVYRVGVSIHNSRARVLEHLKNSTTKNGYCIWDIDKYQDKSILLFNVKNKADNYWLLALEMFLEKKFKPKIPAARNG